MKVIIFGATGMVGQGVLRECLLDPGVESVLVIGRSPVGQRHGKLREVLHQDFYNFSALEGQVEGYDACFFCLGVSSVGMEKDEYTRVTYDITMAAARMLVLVPGMTFIYVSGMGTDSTEKGRSMWARVKGKTENDLLRMPFKAAYMFRPGLIQPQHGVTAKNRMTRVTYAVLKPIFPLLRALFSGFVTTSEQVGRAMIKASRDGYPKRVLDNRDINNI
ncbi:MAG: epimerase [Firmicutes bacterium]|nr:epimerase [Bacillota bacterium]